MGTTLPTIDLIKEVAHGLDSILPHVVFVGGSVLWAYVDNPVITMFRPTIDVDCIIEVTSYTAQAKLDKQLRILGFRNDNSQGAPICRWIYHGIKVDIMPSDENILGFSNIWYQEGMKNSMRVTLADSIQIRLLSFPYFVASKLEAFNGRGKRDFLASHDLEDVLTVLDGHNNLSELNNAPVSVSKYLKKEFTVLFQERDFIENISGHFEPGITQEKRVQRIINFINNFVVS